MAKPLKNVSAGPPAVKIRGKKSAGRLTTLPPSTETASVRALTQLRTSEDFSSWNQLLKLGQRFTEKFMSLLPVVLEDKDPGAVRKLRIVIRRLELMLYLIYGKPSPPYARKLRGRIKRCRRVLSSLADCDVLLKIAEGALAETPTRDAAAWQALARFIQKRRARVSQRSLAKVRRLEFSSPCPRVEQDFQTNGARPRIYCGGKPQYLTPQETNDLVQQRILRSLTRLWRSFELLVERSREDSRVQVIHGIRIVTKRLRHLVEVMKKLEIAGSREVLARLRELQRTIGDWHDIEVLEHTISELLVQKKFVRNHLELAVEIEELFLRKSGDQEEFRRKVLPFDAKLTRLSTHQELGAQQYSKLENATSRNCD